MQIYLKKEAAIETSSLESEMNCTAYTLICEAA